jgi:hypothetical protein
MTQDKVLPARLLLGASTLDMIESAEAERAKQLERWRPVSKAVDFDAEVSIDEVTPRD